MKEEKNENGIIELGLPAEPRGFTWRRLKLMRF